MGESRTVALRDDIHRLVRTHKTRVQRDDGQVTLADVSGLFHQLRLAKVSDHRATKGPSGTGGRIPLALPALMLMSEVEETLTGWCTAAGVSAGGSVEARLLACQAWAEEHGTGEELASLGEQCAAWVNAITGMLNPLPRVEIKGSCPNCFESHVSEINEDGERIRNMALNAQGLIVTCRNCESSWEGQDLHQLAGALA
jgi:hypothetical protein